VEGGAPRVGDPTLLRHGIWTAAGVARDLGMPLQVHSGFGDPDLRIDHANPALLTDLVKALGRLPVDIVFLHCYPYHREAAYLAAIYPNVYLDLGSALNHAGPSARSLLAQGMEIAPFTKHLFSSDAFGLAELYLLGAASFRRALAQVLQAWIDDDQCTREAAQAVAAMLGHGNAARVYRLAPPGTDVIST
jgi:predicted TIM-barrel fold metal-dependent hydrolase